MHRVRLLQTLLLAAMVPLVALTPGTASAAKPAKATLGLGPQFIAGPLVSANPAQPPTSAQCIADFGLACYAPSDIRAQYDINPLYAQGTDGTGQTIVIFDSFGSPTIQQDLATFDADYGLPAPSSFNIYEPEGKVILNYDKLGSPVDFNNKNIGTEIGWAYETTLDVEWGQRRLESPVNPARFSLRQG
jgi:subtilase family serine protease